MIIILCILLRCLRCYLCSQDCANTTTDDSSPRVARRPYQQPAPPRVIRARPIYNVTATSQTRSTFEVPPPSYEAATATTNLSSEYPSVSPPTSIATTEEINLRV